jgi:hypothetical protein
MSDDDYLVRRDRDRRDMRRLREEASHEGWRWGRWLAGGVLALSMVSCGVGLLTGAIGTAGNVASTPGRVVNEVVKTENVLTSYKQFYGFNQRYRARLADIKNWSATAEAETDPAHKRMLAQNILAMRSVCIDLAERYNASAEMLTSSWFRDQRLPENLDPAACNR